MKLRVIILYVVIIFLIGFVLIPHAIFAAERNYKPAKVVYDISSSDSDTLGNILDRVGLLQKIYNNDSFEASIVLVIHEGAIPLFRNLSPEGTENQEQLMVRARSLAMGEIIQFRVCEASARMQQITSEHLHDFVSMVPMADAEIIKLQHAGYAYLR